MPNRFYGWKRQQPDHRDRFMYVPRMALPPKVDLRTDKTMVPPLEPNMDQGALGSCGPNSAAMNLVYLMLVQDQPPIMPSRLFIYYATRQLMGTVNQDSGVDNRTMMKALTKFGWCDESLCPYDISQFKKAPSQAAQEQALARRIPEYQFVDQTFDAMRGCIAAGRPFIYGFTVYDSFESADVERTGIVPMPSKNERVRGGHDVLIDGYNDETQMFEFDNPWGESWGNGGRGKMPYQYAFNRNLAGDFVTIINDGLPQPGPPTPPDPTPVPPVPGTNDALITVHVDGKTYAGAAQLAQR